MSAAALRHYQHQAVRSASPAALVDKLYGIGVTAARAGDPVRTRRVLVELSSALDVERGGPLAESLRELYAFAIRSANAGDLGIVADLLDGLRDAWRAGPLATERAGGPVSVAEPALAA
ncbi:flagellar export chaperone FliS [Rubrivirga sp. IMCC43871]|uniref:flagellar export chaperone FliS n=1 Tax=Rubrivirga sp. IMCC43871 TaxID=3391575 RepID=UPI00398FAC32